MGLKRTDEFRKDAVHIALTSGLCQIMDVSPRCLRAFRSRPAKPSAAI